MLTKNETMKNYFDSQDLKEPIPVTYGLGVEFENKSGKFVTIDDVHYKDGREITLTITSFVGISMGAIHCYGRLVWYDLPLKCLESKDKYHKVGDISSISGAFEKPEETEDGEVVLRRLITKEELKDKDRFEGYSEDSWINCFDTAEEVLKLGKEIHKKYFSDWKLIIDDCS